MPNISNIFEGGKEQIHLTKSKIYSNSLKSESILICAADESSNGAIVWDLHSTYQRKVSVRQLVQDIELIENPFYSTSPVMSCLTENAVNFYKIC